MSRRPRRVRAQSNDKADQAAPPRTPLPRKRKLLFIAISITLPLLLFALLELILRLCGLGGYPPTFVKVGPTTRGTLVITDTPGPASFFFASRSKPGSMDQYAFFTPKPANTIRILLCGESAAKGFPEPMAFASSAFLKEMLGDVWPGKTVEVINLGTTAIASFPVLEIMTEALDYQPDLVVAYVGNNEFFGAYGVTSLHSAGRSPGMIRTLRTLRSLALLQGLDRLVHPKPAGPPDRTLMEAMIGQSYTAPDDPVRDAAARNLATHVGTMIERCQARNVPIIVCTPPCNERDLAPLGDGDPSPPHARSHYLLGQAHFSEGRFDEASREFQAAIDLDPLPWRAPEKCVAAIRNTAAQHGAVLCDLQQAFHDASPGHCIGWELMEDHVHPSLAGQALVARTIVKTLTGLTGTLAVPQAAFDALPSNDQYAQRLGENMYDHYAVAHTVRVLCNIPFFRQTNPHAFERFNKMASDYESQMPPPVLEAAREWQKPTTHPGGQRPISGMVARALMRMGKFDQAEPLLHVAQRCVPLYSSWNLEYAYFMLACREKIDGKLDEPDRQLAADAIERGKFLLGHGRSDSGMAERYVGRLHQLRGEFEAAIPFLLAARPKLSGSDVLGIDEALVLSYVRTGRLDEARTLVRSQAARGGEFATVYRQLETMIPKP